MVSARQEYTSAIHLDLLVILIPGIFLSPSVLAAQVSSIPIVDENDSLIDIYCRR